MGVAPTRRARLGARNLQPALVLLLASLCFGCINSRVNELPAYHALGGREPQAEVRVYYPEQIDTSQLPAAVPVASIGVAATDRLDRDALAGRALSEAKEIGADFVVVGLDTSYQTGAYHQYVGYGAGFSSPTYGTQLQAVAYRVCPSKLGVQVDGTQMVVSITNESVREAGLLEGDRLISINGRVMEASLSSQHFLALLEIQPGDSFEMIWVRPGEGRLQGAGVAMPNPPTHLSLPSSTSVKTREPDSNPANDF